MSLRGEATDSQLVNLYCGSHCPLIIYPIVLILAFQLPFFLASFCTSIIDSKLHSQSVSSTGSTIGFLASIKNTSQTSLQRRESNIVSFGFTQFGSNQLGSKLEKKKVHSSQGSIFGAELSRISLESLISPFVNG